MHTPQLIKIQQFDNLRPGFTINRGGGIPGKAAVVKAGAENGMDGFMILFDEWADFQMGGFELDHGPSFNRWGQITQTPTAMKRVE